MVKGSTGIPRRAILKLRQGDPKPLTRPPTGKKYSYSERMSDGVRVWDLTRLDGSRGGWNYAPESARPIFLQVIADCRTKNYPDR